MRHGPDLLLPTVGRVAVVLPAWVWQCTFAHAATGWGMARWWHAGLCCLVFRGGHAMMYMPAVEQ
jgi:hypothetical protein